MSVFQNRNIVIARCRKRRMLFPALCVLASLAGLCGLAVHPARSSADTSGPVKYRFKVSDLSSGIVDVNLKFKIPKGRSVDVKPFGSNGTPLDASLRPKVELVSAPVPEYEVKPLSTGGPGWSISSSGNQDVSLDYRLTIARVKSPQNVSFNPLLNLQAPSMVLQGFVLLNSSEGLLCPQEGGRPLSESYSIAFTLPKGATALTPWKGSGGTSSFSVSGSRHAFDNYLAIGAFETSKFSAGGTAVTLAFAGDLKKAPDDERSKISDGIRSMFTDTRSVLGGRAQLDRLAIVAFEGSPGVAASMDSILLGFDGRQLSATNAASAARGLFELWNGYQFTPAPDGKAVWYHQGMPLFYQYRTAVACDLMSSGEAYRRLSTIYTDYMKDPTLAVLSDGSAATNPATRDFYAEKSALVCASVAQRLWDQSKHKKDIDFLAQQVAKKYDGFEGRYYTMVDIEEILENATGKSWSRFFADYVEGTKIISASDFSQTSLFGEKASEDGAPAGQKVLANRARSNWIWLVVAVLFIFSIPIIFSTYVRRAVKLDITMPKILPDFDEDEEEEDEQVPAQPALPGPEVPDAQEAEQPDGAGPEEPSGSGGTGGPE